MQTRLTIAVPTYNRAALLDKQLAWLAGAIIGFEPQCEIIISDNCSSDSTPQVIEKWRPQLEAAQLKITRHPENIGAVRNIAYLLNAAQGTHVWAISDDDPIKQHTIGYVVDTLSQHPDLGLLILNFSSRWVKTGEMRFERCYTVDNDDVVSNGRLLFERCAREDYGGLALTTAMVYRTDLVQRAFQEWPVGLRNLDVQRFWGGYCALHGSVKVTREIYLECAVGDHFFSADPKLNFLLHYADKPEVTVRLMKLGYSRELSRQLVMTQLRRYCRFWVVLSALVRWPGPTLDALQRYALAVLAVHPLEDGGWKLWRWLVPHSLPRG